MSEAPKGGPVLGDLIRRNGRLHTDDTAYVCDGRRITFAAHLERAERLAHALRSLGLRHQSRVAVMGANSYDHVTAFSACELAGFVAVTVNYRLAAPEVEQILTDSTPVAMIVDPDYAPMIDEMRARLPGIRHFIVMGDGGDWALALEDLIAGGRSDEPETWTVRPEDIIHIIYTSGTTGRPKGVMRSHFAELAMAEMMTAEVGLLSDDIVQVMMPIFHVGARWLLLGAQLRAATLILHLRFDEAEVIRTIERERVTLTHMAPTLVQRVLDNPLVEEADCSSLRTIYYSAAPMPLRTLQRGLSLFGNVFVQLYGMTEGAGTTLMRNQHRPDGSAREQNWLNSVGQAPYSVKVRVVDDDGRDTPMGQPGEVVTRTPTRMSGYWNNSAATAEAVREDWYHTGDIGYLDEQGFLYLVDRKKDMIISGGENIYCREVEQALGSHPGLAEVAVFGTPDPEWGEVVTAAVVVVPCAAPEQDDLDAHVSRLIARYKRPRRYIFLPDLPRLNTGKVDKIALRARKD